MDSPKRVPWRDWSDWLSVYHLLSSNRDSALQSLSLWQSRGPLPVLIDSTRVLLAVSKHTCGNCNFNDWKDDEMTRMMLGMSVLRVVNQVTDLHQKSKNAIPIAAIAGNIELPEYIVDVRHAATHGDLPDLFLLSKAVRDLYAFLFDTYWQVQYSALQQIEAGLNIRFEKYLRKAKHTTDERVLKKTASEAFKQEEVLRQHTEWLPKKVIEIYLKVQEDSWIPMVVHLHSVVPDFSSLCVETALQSIEKDVSTLGQMKPMLEALVSVCSGLKVPMTRAVKHLLTLGNSSEDAFELTTFLIEAGVFPDSTLLGIREIHAHSALSLSGTTEGAVTERDPALMHIWTRVKYWSEKDVGSCSLPSFHS